MSDEKKKSKAQLKKEETELKYAFITRAYSTVLALIPEQTRESRAKLKVHLTHTNYNRYVKFDAYGRSLNIQVFGDGNVAVELTEFCHDKHTETLFAYSPDPKEQEAFLLHLKDVAAMLMDQFMEKGEMDWHSYMDYVEGEHNVEAAYQQMMADCTGYAEARNESE